MCNYLHIFYDMLHKTYTYLQGNCFISINIIYTFSSNQILFPLQYRYIKIIVFVILFPSIFGVSQNLISSPHLSIPFFLLLSVLVFGQSFLSHHDPIGPIMFCNAICIFYPLIKCNYPICRYIAQFFWINKYRSIFCVPHL